MGAAVEPRTETELVDMLVEHMVTGRNIPTLLTNRQRIGMFILKRSMKRKNRKGRSDNNGRFN
jgi:hypothetical protein